MDSILKQKLRRLVEHQDWEAIYDFASFTKDRWHNAPVKAEDQFNTVYNLAMKEGRIEGLQEFINTIEQVALDN